MPRQLKGIQHVKHRLDSFLRQIFNYSPACRIKNRDTLALSCSCRSCMFDLEITSGENYEVINVREQKSLYSGLDLESVLNTVARFIFEKRLERK
jgi:hypothetical protein